MLKVGWEAQNGGQWKMGVYRCDGGGGTMSDSTGSNELGVVNG